MISESSLGPSAGSSADSSSLSSRSAPLPPVLSFPWVSKKAFSPVRSVRKNRLLDHSLGISRSKIQGDDRMSLLYNMNNCYSKAQRAGAQHPPEQGEQDGNPAARHRLHLGRADRPGLAPHYCQPTPPATRGRARHPGHCSPP